MIEPLALLTITATVDQLANRCGATRVEQREDVTIVFNAALTLLEDVLAKRFRTPPGALLDSWVLLVGRAMWDGRKARTTGGGQLAAGEVAPPPMRDPLAVIGPQLPRYVVMGL